MALEQITFNIGAFNDADASGNNYFAGKIYEVFNTNDTLADIYSDAAGANPINQDGISNKSNSSGEVAFYIDKGSYYIVVDGYRRDFQTSIKGLDIINDTSQTYDFESVDDFKSSGILFPDGKQIRLRDRYATYTKHSKAGAGASNDIDIIESSTVDQSLVFNDINGGIVSVRQMGIVGDGVTDDTAALSHALNNYSKVVGVKLKTARLTSPIIIESPVIFDLCRMSVVGESVGDSNPWFYIRSSDVIIENGDIGDGAIEYAKAIVIGDYGDAELFFRNIKIRNNRFKMNRLYTTQAVVSGHGRVFELTIEKNRFESTYTYTDSPTNANTAENNVAAIFMQNGFPGLVGLGQDANQDWNITKNRCIGFPYLFNNQSTGVTSGVKIVGNLTTEAMMGLRVYHIYDCIVDKNIWRNCIDTQHVWQRTTFTKNKFTKCGQLTPFNRSCFKVEAGTSLNISGNEMRESLGDAAIIDGGNSDFSYGPNNIHYKSGGVGLRVRAPGEYPGQITGLGIAGNRFVENADEAIVVEVASAIRGLTISGNVMAANGLNNVGDVAAILFNNPNNFAINDAQVAFNTIRNNDVVGGIQTAKTKWAVKHNAPGVAYAEILVTKNITTTELLVEDTRTGGTGVCTAYDNFVTDITDPQLVGWVWSRNYNRTDIQIQNNRTSAAVIGVLTPLYLGEEVFSTSEQNWYKGIGASLGPWTNADWKLMT